ncbi:MAG: iron-containing alcohol dehydrogenase [Ruminococcaceae bacterium]|nr:iron-containing alcohol dehydrogenase [Oscillospiraceae bacterium]
MNIDFNYWNPTKIYFGKTAMDSLETELKNYGKNILLVYGKESIKKIGLYDKVINALNNTGKSVTELSGIKSNPTYAQMMDGAKLVRENNIDLILAVGGGSVIDCAKGISVSAYCKDDPWQKYWIDFKEVDNKIVPVGSILTMTGTASEMNGGSVITNEDEMLKVGRVFSPEAYPKFSILNPELTYSVPKIQMVSGVYDIFSHLMEQYFSGDDDNTSDYVIEGVMKSLITSTRKALKNPQDYEARSNIMWCATLGLNYIAGVSKEQDWEVHNIEHQVGAYTDCPHGVGLAIVSIPYYKHIYKYGLAKFVRFAKEIWNVATDGKTDEEVALAGIESLKAFIEEIGIPTRLRDIGAKEDTLKEIAYSTYPGGGYKMVECDEIYEILKECF